MSVSLAGWKLTCLGGLLGGQALVEDAHDIGFLHDDELLAVDLDLRARPFAEQNAIADAHIERLDLALLVAGARSDGDNLALLRLFLRRVGDEDTAGSLAFLRDAAHQHAVVERHEFHGDLLKRWDGLRARRRRARRRVHRSPEYRPRRRSQTGPETTQKARSGDCRPALDW